MLYSIAKTSMSGELKIIPLFKLIIVTILAVAFWRGLWWLFDKYFFPENPTLSNLLCLFVPIVVVVIWAHLSGFRISWNMDFPSDHHVF